MDRTEVTKRKLPAGKACKACRTRKHRCNGTRPQCSNCANRGVTCEYPQVPAEEMSITELRSVMEAKIRREAQRRVSERSARNSKAGFGMPLAPSSHGSQGPVDMLPLDLAGRPAGPTVNPMNRGRTSSRESSPDTPEPEIAGPAYFGESSTFAFVSKVQEQERSFSARGANKRRRLATEHGGGGPELESINLGLSPRQEGHGCFELPTHLADSLLDAYFARVHRLYPYVHEGTFRLEYERIRLRQESGDPGRLVWVGLLNMIFAHGVEFSDLVPEEDSVAVASRFVNNARRIIFTHVFSEASLELVQALLLLCQYLQSTLELNECWNLVGVLIRTAVGLGLHLNPASDLPFLEREIRIRTWWGCFIIDRTLSMKFGRPPTIDGATAFDVDLPLEVDDEYFDLDSAAPRQPENRPSLITFFSRTVGIVEIMGRVLQELYHPRKANTSKQGITSTAQSATHSYVISRATVLDSELVSLWDLIPDHLKQEPCIQVDPAFELQQNVLLTRYISLRLLIHRQTFLVFSRHEINDHFQRAVAIASCRVCVSMARQTIEVVHKHHHRRMLNSLWYSLHYVFTAMGVLLSLRTMDKSKLDAIGETSRDDTTLELGMEFLKTASRISTLAAKYVAMLKRIWSDSSVDKTSMNHAEAPSLENEPLQSDSAIDGHHLPPPNNLAPDMGLPNLLAGVPMYSDMDMMDFNSDLLFGTGLPRDLLLTDWSTFGLSL